MGFYIAAYSIACVLFVLLLYPTLAIAARLPMRAFARAALPAQTIAFSSSSSIASLPALVRGAEERAAASQGRHRIRAAAGRLGLQVRGAGVVDVRHAVHRLVLSGPARTHGLPDDCLRRSSSSRSPARVCPAGRS